MNISFQGYIPTRYYAKSSKTGTYLRVSDMENIKKCQKQIVSILNGTKTCDQSDKFIEYYEEQDKEYRARKESGTAKLASSIYLDESKSYIVTGKDVDFFKDMGYKTVGVAQFNSINSVGRSDTIETEKAKKIYENHSRRYLEYGNRVKDKFGNKLLLKVYFVPNYYKTGPKKGKFKSFTFVNAGFVDEKTVLEQDALRAKQQEEKK